MIKMKLKAIIVKAVCKVVGHDWWHNHWMSEDPYNDVDYFSVCKRCGVERKWD